MKISDLKQESLSGTQVWVQTISSADSTTLIKSDAELHQWCDDFIERHGDAEIILGQNKRIEIDKTSNSKFAEWYDSYISDKAKTLAKWGTTE